MKKTIFTLIGCIFSIVAISAQDLIAEKHEEEIYISWKLYSPDLEEYLLKFESRYPGFLGNENDVSTSTSDWQNEMWNTYVPEEIKKMVREQHTLTESGLYPAFLVSLYIDKEGNIFSVEFRMSDEIFQKLHSTTTGINMLNELYNKLLKEKCEIVKERGIRTHNREIRSERDLVRFHGGDGKDYVILVLIGNLQEYFGTQNISKILRI